MIISDSEVCRHYVSTRARSVCAGWMIDCEVLPCRDGDLARVARIGARIPVTFQGAI